ncbi:MAG: hypothetical protein HOW73_21545 [Polyangiaceae bacterium]|nr:hypothetical protein [Polyangiaceae bacterium]
MGQRACCGFVLSALIVIGCAEASDGDDEGGTPSTGGTDATGGNDAGGAEAGGQGEGGTGGSPPQTSCEPSDGDLVGSECGIFVNPAEGFGGDGSPESPYRGVAEAIDAAAGQTTTIYVCAGQIEEALTVPATITLYGGLDCDDDWKWELDHRTQWTADTGDIPLTIVGAPALGGGRTIAGFDVVAQNGAVVGESSVAGVVNGGFVTLERMSFVAGDAVNGQPTMAGQSPNGGDGSVGGDGVGASQQGTGGASFCGSVGGNGGSYAAFVATSGVEGEPNQNNGGPTTASGGDYVCYNGGPGLPGAAGPDGADASTLGTIDTSGFHAASGTAGMDGVPGGGGGGGGALFNAAGGGGGGGGCGGTAGIVGTGGGSSIGLILLDATVTWSDVRVEVGTAGDGGIGWSGGAGGIGAGGGQGVSTACDGGTGGNGGAGGRSGSGAGGHAVGIAYTGIAPALDGITIVEPSASQAGIGPAAAIDGVAATTLGFDIE